MAYQRDQPVDSAVVFFQASELDRDIADREYFDDRLSREDATRYHVFRNGTWSNLGPQSITLGTVGCEVRLYWEASAS